MLNLAPTPNTHRQADNLIPLENNQYETRPGFFQVMNDPIVYATEWGEAVAIQMSENSDENPYLHWVWHGGYEEFLNLPEITNIFTGTLFQSLTSLGNRENRLYLSNGASLYYLHHSQISGGTVTGVTVEPEAITILVGAKTQLKGVPVPKWSVNPAMTWASNNENIATVDDRGLVSARAEGETTITATTEEGSYSASSTITVTPFIPVTAVTLDENDIELELPKTITHQLTVTVEPDNATNHNVLWRFYDESIATVDEYGKVTGISEGETMLVVMSENGGLTDRATITVTSYVAVTGVTVDMDKLNLAPEETVQLIAEVEPEDASNKNVTWTTDNEEIAIVSDIGLVTAVAAGTVYITVTTEEGSFADKCLVIITEESSSEPV